jgi:hypothetical protein
MYATIIILVVFVGSARRVYPLELLSLNDAARLDSRNKCQLFLAPANLSPHPIGDADDRQRRQTDSGNRTWCRDNGAGKNWLNQSHHAYRG